MYSFLDDYGPEGKQEREPGAPEHRNDAIIPRPMEARFRKVRSGVGNLRGAVGMNAMMLAADRVPGGNTYQKPAIESPQEAPENPQTRLVVETFTVEDSQTRVAQAIENAEGRDA